MRAYLSIDEVVKVAHRCGADAIYPGYGFLSQSPRLALAYPETGIVFVGPSPELLELAGNKANATPAAHAAGTANPALG